MKEELTQERLKEILHYNCETGVFKNTITRSPKNIKGETCGNINNNGYTCMMIGRRMYFAHRLAWLYIYGYHPENYIDHINRNRSDNRLSNLREVSNQCNSRNSKVSSNNKTGVKGVSWKKNCNKWVAQITVNRRNIVVGMSEDFIESVKFRWEAEKKYNFPDCCTTSSSYLYLQNIVVRNKHRKFIKSWVDLYSKHKLHCEFPFWEQVAEYFTHE